MRYGGNKIRTGGARRAHTKRFEDEKPETEKLTDRATMERGKEAKKGYYFLRAAEVFSACSLKTKCLGEA
jgi:hypothetical protein